MNRQDLLYFDNTELIRLYFASSFQVVALWLVNPVIFVWGCVSVTAMAIIFVYEALILDISFDEDVSDVLPPPADEPDTADPVQPDPPAEEAEDEDDPVVIEENID